VNSVKQAHGEVRFWEHPLLREEMVQSSCISCHIDVRLPGAEVIARGEKLFVQLGCHGCHLVEGYGELDKVGPYLRRIAAKAEPGWLARWIENPREFRSQTKMPDFFYDMRRDEKDEEARAQSIAIAAYLLDAAKEESEKWLAGHPPPRGIDPQDPVKVNAGKDLVDSIGCRGCHGFAEGESPALLGESKDIAPNLSGIAEKVDARWLYHWLKNPRHYSPVARMPSLRLSDEEAVSIASYLMTLGSPKPADADLLNALGKKEVVERGKTLVRKYGCFGCHDIPGMEAETRIGVELSTFGSKLLEELFFGNRTDVPVTWYHWTYHKLKDPRTYATERIEQIMPQFSLAEADVKALMVFLKSRSEEEVPEQYHPAHIEREKTLVRGRLVVEKYNCVGCHVIEGQGGAILARYEEAPTMGPPILNGQGAKVQPDWLFGFLKRPVSLRPWLRVRMPTFGLSDEEATVIVQYFLAQEKVTVPFTYVDVAAIPAEHVEAGRLLMSPDYLNCFSCHQQGERKPEGPEEGWAPDLALARERLNPDWVIRWLRDPQALQPGTKMPSFYNFEDETPDGPEDILGGSDERQVEALRDYIMTLSPMPSPVLAGAKGSDGRQAMPN
jgi:mono/diheme cytochrome c family protein